MAKKQKKKCYAIHFISEKKDEIVYSWDECQKKMKGYNNMFKGFMTEEEASAWLKGITKEKEELHNRQVKECKNRKIQKSKTYEVVLDEEHSKILDKWLTLHKTTLSNYLKEVIDLDMRTSN